MNLTEKRLSSQSIYKGKILELTVDSVVLPDGNTSKREIVRHSGGAAVLFIRDGKIALVRQYRYAYGEEIYEIPAGKLNVGEDPLVAAARELEEETGYRAETLSHLLDIYPSPGYTDEVIHIYCADRAVFVGEKPDDGEFLSNVFMPIAEVKKLIDDGTIKDAKTVCAVCKYFCK